MIFNSEASPQWSNFAALVIAPVRNTRDEGDDETCIDICTVTALQGWTVFGRDNARELHPIHDTMHSHGIIAPLFHAVAVSSLPVIYQDADAITPPCSLYDLCDRLAEIIHEALDADEVDTPARDDAFENHPLCELREVIGRRAGYFGIEDDTPDPYDALRQCVSNLEQMQGMFSDSDGTIAAAIEAGHEALDALPPM